MYLHCSPPTRGLASHFLGARAVCPDHLVIVCIPRRCLRQIRGVTCHQGTMPYFRLRNANRRSSHAKEPMGVHLRKRNGHCSMIVNTRGACARIKQLLGQRALTSTICWRRSPTITGPDVMPIDKISMPDWTARCRMCNAAVSELPPRTCIHAYAHAGMSHDADGRMGA